MSTLRMAFAFVLTSCLALSASPGIAQTAPSLALLRRATDPNPSLKSYTAAAHLSAMLHALLPLHKTLDGTVYYLKPRRKIEFRNVSGALGKFKDLISSTPSYDEATTQYQITPLSNDGSESTYVLVPRKAGGRVKSITLRVNNTTALIDHAEWAYTNGGRLTFDETYQNQGPYRLMSQATIGAHFPGYSVNGTLTFTNYQLNAPVSPSTFGTSQQQTVL